MVHQFYPLIFVVFYLNFLFLPFFFFFLLPVVTTVDDLFSSITNDNEDVFQINANANGNDKGGNNDNIKGNGNTDDKEVDQQGGAPPATGQGKEVGKDSASNKNKKNEVVNKDNKNSKDGKLPNNRESVVDFEKI